MATTSSGAGYRKIAVLAGVFFIVAAATAIVGLLLYQAVLNNRTEPRPGSQHVHAGVPDVQVPPGCPIHCRAGAYRRAPHLHFGSAVLFGLYGQVSPLGAIAAIPVFAWEMSLAVWLIAKGFMQSPIISAIAPL